MYVARMQLIDVRASLYLAAGFRRRRARATGKDFASRLPPQCVGPWRTTDFSPPGSGARDLTVQLRVDRVDRVADLGRQP